MKGTPAQRRARMTQKELENEYKQQQKAKAFLIAFVILAIFAIAFYFFVWPIFSAKVLA